MAGAAVAAAGSSSNSSGCICFNADVLAVPAIDAAVGAVVAAVAAVVALVVAAGAVAAAAAVAVAVVLLLLMLLLLLPMRTGCVDHSIPAYILAPPACVGSAFSQAFVYRLVSITIVAAVSCKH